MDDDAIIAAIRRAIENDEYEIDRKHCDPHIYTEGFALRDALHTIIHGRIIEVAGQRSRWLFCHRIGGLKQDRRFRGQWLHVCVEWPENSTVAVVTMYRPAVERWRTEKDRR